MAMPLRLNLLGDLELITAEGQAVALHARKAAALLAYLAVNAGRAQPRDRLAALLWPDKDPAQGRTNLRQTLAALKRALPVPLENILSADTQSLRLVDAMVLTDVTRLESLLTAETPQSLDEAAVLYRGDLLAGFTVRAPEFEDWLRGERQRLRERLLEALQQGLETCLAEGDDVRAVALGHQLLTVDPLREAAHRALMCAFVRQGQVTEALRQYRRCRQALREELGVAPETETEGLHRELLRRRRVESGSPVPAPEEEPPVAALREDELRMVSVAVIRLAALDVDDTEALDALLTSFRELLTTLVSAHGGTLAGGIGDAAVIVFGLPQAHSDDTERALRCAEASRAALRENPSGDPRTLCAGIACGQILARATTGDAVTTGGAVVGHAAHLAFQAGHDQILVSRDARSALSAKACDWRFLPATGVADAWRVAAAEASPEFPLVGRQAEKAQFAGILRDCLESGRGHVICLRGEAGIGKTRLANELCAKANAAGFACQRALVLDFGATRRQEVPRVLACGLLGAPPEAEDARLLDRLDTALSRGWVEESERIFLLDLLQLPLPFHLRTFYDAMDSETRRRGSRDALAQLAVRRSVAQPVLACIEDIHWADADTIQALAELAAANAGHRVLLLLTLRPERDWPDADWRRRSHGACLTTVDLGPLSERESHELAAQFADTDTALVERCVARAEGNPLYLEQLLRHTREGSDALPASLLSIVQARLDGLTPADRTALQAASVLGQHFTLPALQYLIARPEYFADQPQEHDLLRADGRLLSFAHALVRDGIYSSLTRSRRELLHRRAADWYAERDLGLHAEHLERAGDPGAAEAYLRAARQRWRDFRYEEALRLAVQGQSLAAELAVGFALQCLEGDLLRDLSRARESSACFERALANAGTPQEKAQGWLGVAAGLRIVDEYDAALAALDRAQDDATTAHSLELLADIHHLRANLYFPLARLDDCLAEHHHARRYADRAGSRERQARTAGGLGDAYYLRGRMVSAGRHFHRCIRLARAHGYGRIEVANLHMRGLTRFYRLHIEEALADHWQAVEMARQVGDHRTEAVVRAALGNMLVYTADWDTTVAESEASRDLARQIGSRRIEAAALFHLAEALYRRDRDPEAVPLLRDAYALAEASGVSFFGAWILGMLALAETDEECRRHALREGERLLATGSVSHNHFHFRQLAMETALAHDDLDAVARHADALERFTRDEPLPWAAFFIDWGRGLVEARRNPGVSLATLIDRARAASLLTALGPLEQYAGSEPATRD